MLLNRTLGRDILPPLLVTFGLSIVIQNGLLQMLLRRQPAARVGRARDRVVPLGGGIAVGVMPLLTLLSAVAVIVAAQPVFYRTRSAARSAPPPTIPISRSSWASTTAASSRRHRPRLRRDRDRGVLSRHARQFRSDHRPGAAALCLRGGDHRRPRQPLGHARRRHHARPRADDRRAHRSGVADPRRPCRLSGRAGVRPRGLFPRALD